MIVDTFDIKSTLDGASGINSRYVYDETKTNLPIVVLVHGFNLTRDAIPGTLLVRLSNAGYFAVAIGMRGRKGATGTRDASVRELHDIYDGINYIKENFPVSDKVIISGYSGGGGNALGFATKFPFVANTVVNHFGMVDYGFDDTESWYFRNPKYQGGIQDFVGYSRTPSNMNYYRSRNAYEALGNLRAKVFNYHDVEDAEVSVELTRYLTRGLQSFGKEHETHISTANDNDRYYHNMSVSEITEPDWLPHGSQASKPTMGNTGSFRVIGYLVTDRFSLFLGNLDDHVADLNYNLTTNQFTIKALTGDMTVRVVKDGLEQVVNVTGTTTFTFTGEEITPEPIEEPKGVKHYFIKENGKYIPIKRKMFKSSGNWSVVK